MPESEIVGWPKVKAFLEQREAQYLRTIYPETSYGKKDIIKIWAFVSPKTGYYITVLVHFYADNNGFEVYLPATPHNTIKATIEAMEAR